MFRPFGVFGLAADWGTQDQWLQSFADSGDSLELSMQIPGVQQCQFHFVTAWLTAGFA